MLKQIFRTQRPASSRVIHLEEILIETQALVVYKETGLQRPINPLSLAEQESNREPDQLCGEVTRST